MKDMDLCQHWIEEESYRNVFGDYFVLVQKKINFLFFIKFYFDLFLLS